jgi:hypothetical protein
MERHPIEERPDLPVERRLQLIEQHLAQLWDQVWWMNLPAEQREAYRLDGFSDPIERFYEDG